MLHVYVLGHIVSESSRTARWILMKLRRNEVLMFLYKWFFRWDHTDVDPEWGKNMSQRTLFSETSSECLISQILYHIHVSSSLDLQDPKWLSLRNTFHALCWCTLMDLILLSSNAQLVGWLVVLRINVDLAIFQPYLDLEAGDNQSLKIQVARPGIEPGPLHS